MYYDLYELEIETMELLTDTFHKDISLRRISKALICEGHATFSVALPTNPDCFIEGKLAIVEDTVEFVEVNLESNAKLAEEYVTKLNAWLDAFRAQAFYELKVGTYSWVEFSGFQKRNLKLY